MIILWDNLIDDATLTASSTKAGSSVDNLKHYHLSKYFSFNTFSGSIVVDLGSAKNIKNLYLVGTNGTSLGTYTIEANTADSWDTPAFSDDLTYYTNGSIGISELDITYRYIRITVDDDSLSYFRIGYMICGDHLQMPGLDPNIDLSYNSTTAVSYSLSQQTYADKGIEYFSATFSFPQITDYVYQINDKNVARREDILEFWSENLGSRPILLIMFENTIDRFPPILGMIGQNVFKFKRRSDSSYSFDFSFVETK